MATERQQPDIESAGSAVFGTGTSLSVPYPTIAAADAGKLLLLAYVNGTSTNVPTTPSGWTIIATATGTNVVTRIYRMLSAGTETGNLSLSGLNSGDAHISRMLLITRADTVEASATNTGSDKTPAHASVTTTGAGRLVLSFMGINDDETASSFTGETGGNFVLYSNSTTALGDDGGLSIQQADLTASGTISGGTWSYSGATEDWADVSFACYAGTLPSYEQDSFRLRDDDGSETGATWLEAANTDGSVALDTNFRIRFLIQQTVASPTPGFVFSSTDSSPDNLPRYQYRERTPPAAFGAWTDVKGHLTNDSGVRGELSPNYAAGDTTQQLGSGTFVGGRITEGGGALTQYPWQGYASGEGEDQLEEHEGEACFQFDSSTVPAGNAAADGDEFEFRVVRYWAGTVQTLDTYTNTPTITVGTVAAGSIVYKPNRFQHMKVR